MELWYLVISARFFLAEAQKMTHLVRKGSTISAPKLPYRTEKWVHFDQCSSYFGQKYYFPRKYQLIVNQARLSSSTIHSTVSSFPKDFVLCNINV